ncbi:MAG TPA: GAF domain-containing protein [Gemmatimonadota bacterium]
MRRYADVALAVLTAGWIVVAGLSFLRHPGYGFHAEYPGGVVRDAPPGGAVRVGDRLAAVDGRRVAREEDLAEALRRHPGGRPLAVELRRRGAAGEVETVRAELPQAPHSRAAVLATLVGMAVGLLFLVVGVFVALRPTGRAGQLFFLFSVAVALLAVPPPVAAGGGFLVRLIQVLQWAALLLGAAFFLHFFLLFPAPHPLAVRFPFVEGLLYAPPAVFLALLTVVTAAAELWVAPDVFVEALGTGAVIVAVSYLIWAVVTFVDAYRRLDDPVEREKLRWLVWGVAISILPAVALLGFEALLGFRLPHQELWVVALLVLLPVSFGYAILSHRLMDIEVVLNRGLVYGAISVVLVVTFIVVENVLAELSLELTGQSSFAIAMGAAIVMAALVDPVKNRVQLFVDRLFFAYKVKLREGLGDLAEELSFITDLDRMEHLLLRRLADLAHVRRAALFLREEGGDGYVLTEMVDADDGAGARRSEAGGEPLRFDANDSFVIWMLREPRPLSLETLPEADFHQRVESREVVVLRRLDAALCLPLRLRGDLIGFLLLSRRRNRELFNRDEIDLLHGLAVKASVDLTNARLQTRSRRLEAELGVMRDELLSGLRGLLGSGPRPPASA